MPNTPDGKDHPYTNPHTTLLLILEEIHDGPDALLAEAVRGVANEDRI
jgi:hypothetical protein